MPKTFTDSERVYIKQRLMEEAKYCLTQFGVRKTTVDELVKRVNIPKGTFYLFYKSKELLIFDVFCAFHDEMQADLLSEMKALKEDVNPEKLTELIFKLYQRVEDSFMLHFLTNGEMELLMRKLPEETVRLHAKEDDFSVEQLIGMLPNMKSIDTKALSAALRGIFLVMLHKREIGEDVFDDALKIMIRGVVIQMFEGESV